MDISHFLRNSKSSKYRNFGKAGKFVIRNQFSNFSNFQECKIVPRKEFFSFGDNLVSAFRLSNFLVVSSSFIERGLHPTGYMVLQVGFLFEDAHRRREKRELSNMAAQFAEDSQCKALYMWLERRDDPSREQVRYVTLWCRSPKRRRCRRVKSVVQSCCAHENVYEKCVAIRPKLNLSLVLRVWIFWKSHKNMKNCLSSSRWRWGKAGERGGHTPVLVWERGTLSWSGEKIPRLTPTRTGVPAPQIGPWTGL